MVQDHYLARSRERTKVICLNGTELSQLELALGSIHCVCTPHEHACSSGYGKIQ